MGLKTKKRISIFMTLVMIVAMFSGYSLNFYVAFADDLIAVSEENFPDVNFRSYVSEEIDINRDGFLSADEIDNTKELECGFKKIISFKGIEYFINITYLDAAWNDIETIDLSNNINLKGIDILGNSNIKELDLCHNINLEYLDCSYCESLIELNLSNCTKLNNLCCGCCSGLSELDLSDCSDLFFLSCEGCKIKILDLSKNIDIGQLYCGGCNELSEINIKNCSELGCIYCNGCTNLECLDLSEDIGLDELLCYDCDNLKNLDLSHNINLERLEYDFISSLDLSNNKKLKYLNFKEDENLKELDLSEFGALIELDCTNCKNLMTINSKDNIVLYGLYVSGCDKLTSLDLSNNRNLNILNCVECTGLSELNLENDGEISKLYLNNCNLSELNLSDCVKLYELYCNNNNLSELNLSDNINLEKVDCSNNKINNINFGDNNLRNLNCANNELTKLDLSSLYNLVSLECNCNQLENLNTDSNENIEFIDCSKNKITSLSLEQNSLISTLFCFDNEIESLNVENNCLITCILGWNNKFDVVNTSCCTIWGTDKINRRDVSLEKEEQIYLDSWDDLEKVNNGIRDSYWKWFGWEDFNEKSNYLIDSYNTWGGMVDVYHYYSNNKFTNDEIVYSKCKNIENKAVVIDENNFKDSNFRDYIINELDLDNDGLISYFEKRKTFNIDCSGRNIKSLNGISKFKYLKILNCNNNNITELNLDKNLYIENLDCSNNKINNIDLCNNLRLLTLNCSDNNLEVLDVNSNDKIKALYCKNNNINKLRFSKCKNIEILYCYSNELKYLNIDDYPKLKTLYAWDNYFKSICIDNYLKDYSNIIINVNGNYSDYTSNDFRKWNGKIYVDPAVYLNPEKENKRIVYTKYKGYEKNSIEINNETFPDDIWRKAIKDYSMDSEAHRTVDGDDYLSDTEVELTTFITYEGDCRKEEEKVTDLKGIEYFSNLEILECYYNNITNLDLSKNIKLKAVFCNNCKLNRINLDNISSLETLDCSNNNLKTLDLSKMKNSYLSLNCSNNSITDLNIDGHTKIRDIDCSNNKIKDLDLSKDTSLTYIECANNEMQTLNLSGLRFIHSVSCENNNIKTLDVSSAGYNLYSILCYNNLIKNLDLTKNKSLQMVLAWDNYFKKVDCGKSNIVCIPGSGYEGVYGDYLAYIDNGGEITQKDKTIFYNKHKLDLDYFNDVSVQYKSQVQSLGWEKTYIYNGNISGTVGKSKRIEAIRIKLIDKYGEDFDEDYGVIKYKTYIQSSGWESKYVNNDSISGTIGKGLRMEAIKIMLEGEIENYYDIYYQVQSEKLGWLGWAKNGKSAGTSGYGFRIEAIRVKLVKKNKEIDSNTSKKIYYDKSKIPVIRYMTQIQSFGWEKNYVSNGGTSGTIGKAKRLEAIRIKLDNNSGIKGGVKYQTHIEKNGWKKYVYDGVMSGTIGKGLRLEAIRINLTGNLSNYFDVYYRVQAQKFGWMGWAKNGEVAGTSGYGYRLEAIQIRLEYKNTLTPGSTENAYKSK